MKNIYGLLVIAFSCSFANANEISVKDVFKDSQMHCTAWKTRKRLALVSIVRPVGINCEISAKLELADEKSKTYRVVIENPLDGFDSGEKDRDLEVKKILGFEKRNNITFISESKTAAEWGDLITSATSEKNSAIKGSLLWTDQSREIEFNYKVETKDEKVAVVVAFDSKFTWFGIEPPSVGGGLIAKVYDELSLYSRLDLSQIEDKDGVISKILANSKKTN